LLINVTENKGTTYVAGEVSQDEITKKGDQNKATTIGAYFTFVNGFIGGGLLGLPYGFRMGGLIAGAIGLVVLALISNFTVRLLAYCKTNYKDGKVIGSYADIGRVCFGRVGVIMVNSSIIMSQMGYCCVYLVFIGKNLSSLTFLPSNIHTFEVILVILPIVTLLVWLRDMKYLSPTSIVANVAVVLAVIAVIIYGFQNCGIAPIKTYEPFLRISTFSIFYGIVAFAYTIHGLALDIHSSMRNPGRFVNALDLSMIFVTIVYLVFGGLGYLFFREETNSVITLNLGNTIENDIIKLCLSVVLLFAFPLQMFPVVQIMERSVFATPLSKPWLDTLIRNILRTVLVCVSAGAAIGIPLFGLFAGFVGTFSNSFIAFIFPPIFYLSLFRGQIPIWKIILCVIICIIGIFGMVVGSVVIVKDIVYDLMHHIDS